ncbi:hypothetical protein C6W92_10300 [Roseovarius sp. A46]|nr:hypothetical protein C6W92_10300 [Roseovarius sp. A46]
MAGTTRRRCRRIRRPRHAPPAAGCRSPRGARRRPAARPATSRRNAPPAHHNRPSAALPS